MPKIAVISLGCAKNLVDTEIMLGQFIKAQWQITQNFAEADLILINTCGFIETAKQESISEILEMAEFKNSAKGQCTKLVVAGCLVQRYAAELARAIPEVDHWIGLGGIGEILERMRETSPQLPGPREAPFLNNQNLPRYQVTLPHTTYVKIAEGCNHHCAYCAIPLIKGNFRSRDPESVIKEVSHLVAAGVKEINLIAQDITMYGKDLPIKVNLQTLLEEMIKVANPQWIRLLYAYPSGISENLLKFISEQPSICKYLDIPLQHVNSRILKLMNRAGSPEQIRQMVLRIKSEIPEIVLRTTFIVGFPTESESEFSELLSFVSDGYFEHVGVFPYSKEEGTAAVSMKSQIRETVKQDRRQRLLEAQQKVSARFLAGLHDQKCEILIDRVKSDGNAIGRTRFFAPEVDGVVYVNGFCGSPGDFIQGRIINNDPYNLWADNLL